MAQHRPDPNVAGEDVAREPASEQFWRATRSIQARNVELDPDTELECITQIVEEVRQERHEATERNAQGSR